MMNLEAFKKLFEPADYEKAVTFITDLRAYLDITNVNLDNCSRDDLELYMTSMIDKNENSLERFRALAKYFYCYNHDLYLYMTGVFGSVGVIESIMNQGLEMGQKIDLEPSVLGETPKMLTDKTKEIICNIKVQAPNDFKKILAGNHHNIPASAMDEEKLFYHKSENLETYLKERHQRKVQELQEHCDLNKVWFEQVITQEVVDLVKNEPEMLSARLEDGYLYVTKIPNNALAIFESDDLKLKRYHYCHCPFAKESILSENPVDSDWCYCSAGFAKYPFEVILDRTLDVEMLESVLKGDLRCRFKIKV